MFNAVKVYTFNPGGFLKSKGIESDLSKSVFITFHPSRIIMELVKSDTESHEIIHTYSVTSNLLFDGIRQGLVADTIASGVLMGWLINNCILPNITGKEDPASDTFAEQFPELMAYYKEVYSAHGADALTGDSGSEEAKEEDAQNTEGE